MHSEQYLNAIKELRENVEERKHYLEDHWDHVHDPSRREMNRISHLEEILDEMDDEVDQDG